MIMMVMMMMIHDDDDNDDDDDPVELFQTRGKWWELTVYIYILLDYIYIYYIYYIYHKYYKYTINIL